MIFVLILLRFSYFLEWESIGISQTLQYMYIKGCLDRGYFFEWESIGLS